MKGFEFNNQSPLKDLLWQQPKISIETGNILNIRLPQGEVDLLFPYQIPEAQEVCLNMMIFCFDLNDGVYEILKFNELSISLKNLVIGRNKRLNLDLAGHKALIIATGIHFRDEWSKINNSKYYSCQITYAATS
ncbi:MAG: hypothetical protein EOP00_16725 [Pedobacter sp.]|nr:MAG: hypothetical protein EOP00_16725 [Pedobacter sp.]